MDGKKCINKVWVDDETHTALLNGANKQGDTIASYAGAILDDAAISEKPNFSDDADPFARLHWNWYRFKLKQRSIEKVHRAAAIYSENPTDENADSLEQMCADAGLDYKDVINRTKNDPFSSIVANSRNGTKYGRCIRWLPDTIVKMGGRVPVSTLNTMAAIEGFDSSMLNRVKRAINGDANTPNILSERESNGWIWVLDEHVQDDVSDIH